MIVLIYVLLLVLVYTWLGYPLILLIIQKKEDINKISQGDNIAVAIVLSAYNEEEYLRERLENLLVVDYPVELVSIHVGLDGCSDKSSAIVREFTEVHKNIHLYDFSERRGKVAVLKDVVSCVVKKMGEDAILVFTDANTMFKANALNRIIPHFSDSNVGGVCGRLVFLSENSKDENDTSEGTYWGMETKLKIAESSLDSCLGANGAIYAIRSELFWKEMPNNILIDDFVLGMKVREQGMRLVYEPDAVAEELLPEQRAEWARRVRIGAGGYQSIAFCKKCLLPRYGKFAWMFWSHKVLRWFTPHILLILLACVWCWLMTLNNSYIVSLIVGILVACVCILIAVVRKSKVRESGVGKVVLLSEHFITMQAALFAGFIRYCRGGLKGHWIRTPR